MRQAEEFETAFVREFATGDRKLGSDLPRHVRQERIRVAIIVEKKVNAPFHGEPGLSYADAYRLCYGSEVELRGRGSGVPEIAVALEEDEEDDEEFDEELK